MSPAGNRPWPISSLLGRLGRLGGGRAVSVTPDLVVMGLGNPGSEYDRTRHNAGFWALERLSAHGSIGLSERRRTCVLGEGQIDGQAVVLARPRTYVNLSGAAARYLLDRYRVGPERILVVCDDMDLAPGRLRLRKGGGPGGHNGLRSVTKDIGGDFPRLRVGVGRPGPGVGDIDHVLGIPGREDLRLIEDALDQIPRVVAGMLSDGMERTMEWANRTGKD